MTHLDRLEAEAIYIMREVAAECEKPVMLYSIGKDSSVMLRLAKKAFAPERPPFPFLHIDTTWKFREMIEFRDRTAKKEDIDLIVYTNEDGLRRGINPFDHGSAYTDIMKTEALKQALDKYGFTAAFGGGRRDEEKSRAKERVFSFRNSSHAWDPKRQRPEFGKLYNTEISKGESIRVFPLSNWTEADVWRYIMRENIEVVPLYFAKERPVVVRDGTMILVDDDRLKLRPGEKIEMKTVRFRTLGCYPLTGAVESNASTLEDVVREVCGARSSERANRVIDFETASMMERRDGKSTLIGHLMYDAGCLYPDQEETLARESKMFYGEKIDYSLLLDGLEAEREQRITIDVAYRFFSTDKRSFIIADTPGHNEYTRNMAVGASFADLAVILVDATKGVLPQTERHFRICRFTGISDFIFAVNKMDAAGYSREVFERVERGIEKLTSGEEGIRSVCLPVSATEGDNIINKSGNMRWYDGSPLLELLENAAVGGIEEKGFVMPVQRVSKPAGGARGYQGCVESGGVSVGDAVTVFPSGEISRVVSLLVSGAPAETAEKGRQVTLGLADEIDISRGCVICGGFAPSVSTVFDAEVLWLDDQPLFPDKSYYMKLATSRLPVTVRTDDIASAVKNGMFSCTVSASAPVAVDRFDRHRSLGMFILIDRVTHATVGYGRITAPRDNNYIYPVPTSVTREDRSRQKGQRPVTLWFTGLPAAGKTTVANETEKRLFAMGKHAMVLDGDGLRSGINAGLGFSASDRSENIRRTAHIARLMNDAGVIALVSLVSPLEKDRRNARDIIGDCFCEVFVSAPVEVCERRDEKGYYKKAHEGKIRGFTGVSDGYETPAAPDLVLDTSKYGPEECAQKVIDLIKDRI